MSAEVTQSKNQLSDNAVMAARDAIFYNFQPVKIESKKLKTILEQFRREKENNQQFCQIVERLAYFKNYADHEVRRTLEEKLKAGNRAGQIKHALRMKERFAQKLIEHELYESAQEADACLLGEVCTRFNNSIYPLILKNESEAAIAHAIETLVVSPVMEILGDDELLSHYREEVFGMIFFLTGNCHINWD